MRRTAATWLGVPEAGVGDTGGRGRAGGGVSAASTGPSKSNALSKVPMSGLSLLCTRCRKAAMDAMGVGEATLPRAAG